MSLLSSEHSETGEVKSLPGALELDFEKSQSSKHSKFIPESR